MEMGSGSEAVPGATGSSDSLNGLVFGKKIYFEDAGSGASGASGGGSSKDLTVAVPVPAAAPPLKKGKGVAQGGGGGNHQQQQQQPPPRCQVEGCKMDLTGAKAYYCRHKVCGMHSKSPKVVVAGIEQRFCQQCSRFHQLHEFDQGKRSCRRRLAGHNERRRKPPPGPLSPHYRRLSPSFYEDNSRFRSFLMDFSYPRTQSPSRDLWPTVRATDRVATGGQWQGNPNAPCSEVVTHPYIHPSSHYTSELPPSECFAGVSDSSCALSLLSNQPWSTSSAPRNRAPNISASSSGDGAPMGQQMFGTSTCMAHPCALSLLSNQPWNTTSAPRNRAPNISASSSGDGVPMGQQMFGTSTCMAHPWGFKNHGAGSTSHEIQHAMGLEHFDDDGNGQFSRELELALQGNRHCPDHGPVRAYDHSCNGMHWSL